MADMAQKAVFQAAPVVGRAVIDGCRHEIAVKSPRFNDERRAGAGLGIVHIRPHLPPLRHHGQRGDLRLAFRELAQIDTFSFR